MGVNSLPKTVTRQRRGCDLNRGPSAPESSTLTTRLPSHPVDMDIDAKFHIHGKPIQKSLRTWWPVVAARRRAVSSASVALRPRRRRGRRVSSRSRAGHRPTPADDARAARSSASERGRTAPRESRRLRRRCRCCPPTTSRRNRRGNRRGDGLRRARGPTAADNDRRAGGVDIRRPRTCVCGRRQGSPRSSSSSSGRRRRQGRTPTPSSPGPRPKKVKGSPYSITARRVSELIPVLGR